MAFSTLTRSLQLISPNLVASLRCLELVLAFSVQSLITGQEPDFLAVTGGALITFGVILIAFQEKFILFKNIVIISIKSFVRPTVYRAEEYERLLSDP